MRIQKGERVNIVKLHHYRLMEKDGKKIGLALSGGGYRAAAYHIGTLRALNRLGILEKVDVISSVSGGSITAAYYALHKDNFDEFENAIRSKLQRGVLGWTIAVLIIECLAIAGLHGWLVSLVIDSYGLCMVWKSVIIIVLSFAVIAIIILLMHKVVPTSCLIEKVYACKFFGKKTLSNLPKTPVVAMNATDVELNRQFTFSQIKVDAAEQYEEGYFKNIEMPISLAVMASSAYPMFAPVRIPRKYISDECNQSPILVDGGIYDNQGAHKLTERGDYHTDYIVVSDAGNTEMNREGTWNIASLLFKVINLMMNRIDKMQRRDNLYMRKKIGDKNQKYSQYAYVVLEWLPANKNLIEAFINNISSGYVPKYVCESHGLTEDLVRRVLDGDKMAKMEAQEIVETHIQWVELYRSQPNKDTIDKALNVGTNLLGLSKCKIDALIKCAEWMTEVQVRTYLPNLIQE